MGIVLVGSDKIIVESPVLILYLIPLENKVLPVFAWY